MKSVIIFWIFMVFASIAAQNITSEKYALRITFENYKYPYPVDFIDLIVQKQPVKMAYMDVKPVNWNGKTVLLLHGKNFLSIYWKRTAEKLSSQGFRVIIPDQLGFGKSSKPEIFYSFHSMAENTRALLDTLKVHQVAVVGHSMGGMLASRFVLMYPERTTHLVLENPIGLEDYKLKIPYASIEKHYQWELAKTEELIREFHKGYYVRWRDEFDEHVQVQHRVTLDDEYRKLAWVNALTSEMIYTQPVVYEFGNIKVPTALFIGLEDKTQLEKVLMNTNVSETGESYVALSERAAGQIPDATVIPFENVGHIPHLEDPERFNQELLKFLNM